MKNFLGSIVKWLWFRLYPDKNVAAYALLAEGAEAVESFELSQGNIVNAVLCFRESDHPDCDFGWKVTVLDKSEAEEILEALE